jgi:O-Antigen ligase
VAVLSVGLLVSFSRSSCLMLMLGIIVLAWRAFGARRTLAVGGIAFVILAGGAIASSHNIRHALTSSHRLSTVSEGRFSLMSGGVKIWRKEPISGSGVGSFQARFTKTETAYQIAHRQVSISHNTPITVLAELGVIGAALFIWLCVATWHVIARSSRVLTGAASWEQWSLLAIIIGIFVHSQLYADLFEDPMLWTALAAALAVGTAVRPAHPDADPRPAAGAG